MGMGRMLRDPWGIYRSDDVLCLTKGVTDCWPSFILPNGSRDIRLWVW